MAWHQGEVSNDDRGLRFGKWVFPTQNRPTRTASLLWEGKLTQAETEGTSHLPAVRSPSTVRKHNRTQRYLRATRAGCVFAISFLGLFGENEKTQNVQGSVNLNFGLMKIKVHSKSPKSRGVYPMAAYVSLRCEAMVAMPCSATQF